MRQGVEEGLVKQLVPEPAIEALHEAVLHGMASGGEYRPSPDWWSYARPVRMVRTVCLE